MKFLSVATALSILSLTNAHTYVVYETDIVTVDAQGHTLYPSTSSTPTTSSTSSTPTTTSTSSTPTTTSTSSTPTSSTLKTSTTSSTKESSTAEETSTSAQQNAKFNWWGGKSSTSSTSSTSTSSTSTSATSTEATSTEDSSSTSTSGSGDVSGTDDDSFSSDILSAHNKKRSAHGVSDLTWSSDAYDYAKKYASKYDCSGSLTHSGGSYGENLAVGYDSGSSAVEAWYDEGKNYDYSSATTFDHFTQIIWKSTTEVGCAYKDCSSENWGKYIICSYNPAGNVVGKGLANILE